MKQQLESKMETLLKAQPNLKAPGIGEVVEAKVVDTGHNAVYLDMGPVGTGIIYGIELKDGLGTYEKLKLGDKIQATVVEAENEEGYVELSLREASMEKAWQSLEEKTDTGDTVKTKVLDANKGGLIVELSGITGFLPVSQLSTEHYPRVAEGDRNQILNHIKSFIGQTFEVQVLSADQEREKLIVSEKAAQMEEFNKAMAVLKIGQEIEGEVSGIADFGVFIKFAPKKGMEPIEGLVHISELAWARIENPSDVAKVGDTLKARVASLDNNRISLSVKDLKEDPWEKAAKKYKKDSKVKGTVKKIDRFGAFIELDPEISGLAHISQFKEIEKDLEIDKEYDFKIIAIEPKDHRLGLELIVKEKKVKPKTTKKTKKA